MMTNRAIDREHEFTLVLDGVSELTEQVESALYESGCDDATISMRSRRLFATFSREAPSLKDAVISAIRNVNSARIGATVVRVDECNLVTLAEIARRIGRTRQLVHQYMTSARGPGGFPPPECEITNGAPLWCWCEVARWLCENDMIKEDVLREAEELAVINNVLELQRQRQMTPELTEEILRFMNVCPEPDCSTGR